MPFGIKTKKINCFNHSPLVESHDLTDKGFKQVLRIIYFRI